MKRIIISPYSRSLRNNALNPKNYPYWAEVIKLLKEKGFKLTQVGKSGEAPLGCHEFNENWTLKNLRKLVEKCHTWISVDNFFPHMAAHTKKPGVVIFAQSDPVIFGYAENINLIKDRKYLRQLQYDMWEKAVYDINAYVSPEEVVKAVLSIGGDR